MICPNCAVPLSNRATNCVCGWRQVTEERAKPILPCQHKACTNGAKHRIRVAGSPGRGQSYLDVCDDHYIWASTAHLMGHLTR